MPQIFDNIEKHLLPTLSEAMGVSERGDFCVGYFNLRDWRQIDAQVEKWTGGEGHCCRLLVGMQRLPEEQLRASMRVGGADEEVDNATAIKWKKQLAQSFRDQLSFGIPTSADEAGLRRLADQITSEKLVVKLFLRHPLHAKLYLQFRQDLLSPRVGYLGSSNLTLSGLSKHGELNVDVLNTMRARSSPAGSRIAGRIAFARIFRQSSSTSSTTAGQDPKRFRRITSTSRRHITCHKRRELGSASFAFPTTSATPSSSSRKRRSRSLLITSTSVVVWSSEMLWVSARP